MAFGQSLANRVKKRAVGMLTDVAETLVKAPGQVAESAAQQLGLGAGGQQEGPRQQEQGRVLSQQEQAEIARKEQQKLSFFRQRLAELSQKPISEERQQQQRQESYEAQEKEKQRRMMAAQQGGGAVRAPGGQSKRGTALMGGRKKKGGGMGMEVQPLQRVSK